MYSTPEAMADSVDGHAVARWAELVATLTEERAQEGWSESEARQAALADVVPIIGHEGVKEVVQGIFTTTEAPYSPISRQASVLGGGLGRGRR